MAIARYSASIDTTITNAFESDLTTRGTGSNMGYADTIEIFSIYGQTWSSGDGQSQELSRAMIQFPITQISSDRSAGSIPDSGSVSFYLRMFNADQPFTLPQDFDIVLAPVSQSWTEGTGLDMDNYQDYGTANWGRATRNTAWTAVGGDYLTASNFTVNFAQGYEDIELNITSLVENWISGAYNNYGLGLRLTASQEAYFSSSTGQDTGSLINNTNGASQSYYTKKFFSRSTEFFFKRPVIEARWDSRISDDRENFLYSSSLAPAADNLNNLYLYNYIRGRLVNIPSVGTGKLHVSFYSSSASSPTGSQISLAGGGSVAATGDYNATASYVKTGIYSCSVALTGAPTPLAAIHDVWHSGAVEYFTGSVYPELMPTYQAAPTFNKITSAKYIKNSYSTRETGRFRFFIRDRNWSPTIYTVSNPNNPTEIMYSASYAIYRTADNYPAIAYGTGSDFSTYLSYDKDGNYFDLDVSLLESGYMYEIRLAYYNDSIGDWQEQAQKFKFRVEE
jgi:hypothetical protein